jgi:hypothetical protein
MIWDKITERQKGILNFDDRLCQAFKRTEVAVFGAGGNGNVLDYLVRLGYEKFNILDYDRVEDTNLNRLPFFPEQAGIKKVKAWETYLKTINPECKISTYDIKLDDSNANIAEEIIERSDIVALCVSDLKAGFIIARICAKMKKRMIIGPGTANCWVVTTVTHKGNDSIEAVLNLNTEKTEIPDIDFEKLLPYMIKMYYFPGRKEKLTPETLSSVLKLEIPPRSCKIFVSMVNASMSWEIVKNTAVLNNIELKNTKIVEFPVIQVFDLFKGSSFYWNVKTEEIGIPNWLDDSINWQKYTAGK